jgi:hypothetical protein
MTETDIDWNDPVARARLIEAIGVDRYHEAQRKWLASITVKTIGGRAIRLFSTRFGRVYAVTYTRNGFATLEEAEAYAASLPPLEGSDG